MLRSMTGFGRGSARVGAAEATVEVRTVNGRYAEATVRGLGELAEHETAVQALVKESIGRGTATVHVSASSGAGGTRQRVEYVLHQTCALYIRTTTAHIHAT